MYFLLFFRCFPVSFEVHAKQEWRHLSQKFEPIYTSLRNWMFTEGMRSRYHASNHTRVMSCHVMSTRLPTQPHSYPYPYIHMHVLGCYYTTDVVCPVIIKSHKKYTHFSSKSPMHPYITSHPYNNAHTPSHLSDFSHPSTSVSSLIQLPV